MSFDYFLFQIFSGWSRQNGFFGGLVIFLAAYLQYFLLAAAIYLFFKKEKNWRRRFFIFLVFVFSEILSRGLLAETIRFFWPRLRPFQVLGFSPLINHTITASFPSGHMSFYFVLALSIFLLDKKWAYFFVGAVLLMGLARVAAGVHWPLDILGGIVIASVSYFITLSSFKKIAKIS